jgi:hypothetical protein
MSNEYDNTTFCDNCGEPTTEETLVVYERLPFPVASANIGESACICEDCNKEPKQPTDENGERHYNWCPCQECETWANALLDWEEAQRRIWATTTTTDKVTT